MDKSIPPEVAVHLNDLVKSSEEDWAKSQDAL